MTEPAVLAIDVGGTKLAAALVSSAGEVSRRRTMATPVTGPGEGEALWQVLGNLADDVLDGARPGGIGVGCGGPLSWRDGTVSPLNIPGWRDFPLRDRLADRYAAPVRLHNDAIAMAVGEHWRGVGQGARAFLGVVVSTGVGGGLVVDGRVVSGATGNVGHIGHVVVEPEGPDCACGGRGCLEAVASGPSTVRKALAAGWRPPAGVAVDGRALAVSARSGDALATAALARSGRALGLALATATHLLELERVAVGGGLSACGELLFGPAREVFARHARMPFAARCEILIAQLGGDAGLVGAAAFHHRADAYWPDHY